MFAGSVADGAGTDSSQTQTAARPRLVAVSLRHSCTKTRQKIENDRMNQEKQMKHVSKTLMRVQHTAT